MIKLPLSFSVLKWTGKETFIFALHNVQEWQANHATPS